MTNDKQDNSAPEATHLKVSESSNLENPQSTNSKNQQADTSNCLLMLTAILGFAGFGLGAGIGSELNGKFWGVPQFIFGILGAAVPLSISYYALNKYQKWHQSRPPKAPQVNIELEQSKRKNDSVKSENVDELDDVWKGFGKYIFSLAITGFIIWFLFFSHLSSDSKMLIVWFINLLCRYH